MKKARKCVDPDMTDPESEDEEDIPTSGKNNRILMSFKKTRCTLSSENEYNLISPADKEANLEFVFVVVDIHSETYILLN